MRERRLAGWGMRGVVALALVVVDLSTRRTVFAATGRHSSLSLAPIVTPRAIGASASIAC